MPAGYAPAMWSGTQALPEDPAELREVAEGLVALVKAQALRIAKLEHQLAGLRRHRFGSISESLDQLQLQLRLEDEEIAAALAGEAAGDFGPLHHRTGTGRPWTGFCAASWAPGRNRPWRCWREQSRGQ